MTVPPDTAPGTRPPGGGLRTTSPVAGLARRRLGPAGVLAQSVSATAPAAAMATSPALVMGAGGGPPSALAYLAATVVVLLVSSCVAQFSRRMVAPGSLYSFTAKGLGGSAALVSGGSLVVGYGFLVAGALTGAALSAVALLAPLVGPGPVPTALAVVLGGVLVVGFALRGVGISARLALALEVGSIGVVGAVLVLLVTRTAGSLDGSRLLAGAVGGGWDPFGGGAEGVLLAVTAFVGFESACAVGAEARRPFVVVPRAVRWTALGAGSLYVLSSAAQGIVFAAAPAGGGPLPLVSVAVERAGPVAAAALELGVLASFLGCATGSLTALVRLLFSMGREGVLPASLGRTGARGTPSTALLPAGAAAVAVPVAALAIGVAGQDALRGLLVVGTCGYLAGYVLLCVATPVFLHRIGELTGPAVVVAAVATAGLTGVLAACAAWAVAAGGGWVLTAVGLLAATVAGAVVLRVRRPAVVARVGLYDETRRQDVLGGRG